MLVVETNIFEGYEILMKNYPYNAKYIRTGGSATETGRAMHYMVGRFHTDMIPYIHYSLYEIFSIIAHIPYAPDPKDETLQRPFYTMHQLGSGGDCDDKAIALASWACLVLSPDPVTRIPYRFIAARAKGRPSMHHVYTDIFCDGKYIHADATYNFNCLGCPRVKYAETRII